MHDPRVVPPGAADALAALARDEVASSLLPPGTRDVVISLLSPRLRPDVLQVLQAADEAEAALLRSESLVQNVGVLQHAGSRGGEGPKIMTSSGQEQ